MPVQAAARPAPFDIVRLGYVELGVRDLELSHEFYVDRLGFVLSERTEDALYLRGLEERCHHSLVLRKDDRRLVHALGFRVADEDGLERAQAYYRGRGADPERVERRGQGSTLRVRDPFGVPLEFYAGMNSEPRLLQEYGHYRGAHIMRIDHVNLFSPDVQSTHEEYARLGFRTTEYTDTAGSDAQLWAVWMHRKGNVHDLALTNGRGPRLHHIGVWVPAVLNIIHACDLLATAGYRDALERGPGRHGISNAFFLYLRDPDGHRVELFTGDYLTVDPDTEPLRWELHDPRRQTLWGHAAPASWFQEGSEFAGTVPSESKLDVEPTASGAIT